MALTEDEEREINEFLDLLVEAEKQGPWEAVWHKGRIYVLRKGNTPSAGYVWCAHSGVRAAINDADRRAFSLVRILNDPLAFETLKVKGFELEGYRLRKEVLRAL